MSKNSFPMLVLLALNVVSVVAVGVMVWDRLSLLASMEQARAGATTEITPAPCDDPVDLTDAARIDVVPVRMEINDPAPAPLDPPGAPPVAEDEREQHDFGPYYDLAEAEAAARAWEALGFTTTIIPDDAIGEEDAPAWTVHLERQVIPGLDWPTVRPGDALALAHPAAPATQGPAQPRRRGFPERRA